MKPFLVADPCSASWDAMRNDGPSRFCGSCQKSVYDLGSLTEKQISGLGLVTGGKFCGRQTIRDGALVVRPEPFVARAPSKLMWPIRAAAVAGALGMAACGSAPHTGDVVVTTDRPDRPDRTDDPTTRDPAATHPLFNTNESAPDVPDRNEQVLAGDIAYEPTMPRQVDFAKGKATLDEQSRELLRNASQFIVYQAASQPGPLVIAIEGHVSADEVGKKGGKALALARAEAAKKHLVSLGVKPEQLRTYGFDAAPVATMSEARRKQARNVTMRICSDCP